MHKPGFRSLLYGILLYGATLPYFLWFAFQHDDGRGFFRLFFLAVTALANAGLLVLPPLGFASLGETLGGSRGFRRVLPGFFWALAALTAGLPHVFLVIDAVILVKFGYHFNGFVWNLLITPGGFESMGLENHTIIPGFIAIIVIMAAHGALAVICRRSRRLPAFAARHQAIFRWWRLALPLALCLLLSLLSTGVADFYLHQHALMAQDAFPFVLTMRMRGAMRSLGFDEPDRKSRAVLQAMNGDDGYLSYPLRPIQRRPPKQPMNIVWLVGESLRADLLNEEAMPNSWQLAAKGHRFTEHYSGGHGTRPGMFSMFYGLYANTWDHFLRLNRGPLLIDWLHADHYQFLCVTSAKFTYPEFDHTIFATLPNANMISDSKGQPWLRDVRNTDRIIDFIGTRDPSRPFFVFSFFESTHAPYTFPDDAVIRPDYLPELNYATLSAKDAPRIYNRAVNAAYHLDRQIGRIITALSEQGLMDNTIIVITGDHGEEFYEKGFLGHNSTFVQEQIRTPWVLYAPGGTPAVHTLMTHHTDMVPTIAPLLGVINPPEDFSVGQNALTMTGEREFFIVCGWEIATIVTQTHKMLLPLGTKARFRKQQLSTLNDRPCSEDEEDDFYAKHHDLLGQAQNDMWKFVANRDDDHKVAAH